MADPTATPPPHVRGPLLAWVALVVLTLLGALSSDSVAPAVLLALAGIKFTLIALVFMDLRHAHRAWFAVIAAGALLVLVLASVARGLVGAPASDAHARRVGARAPCHGLASNDAHPGLPSARGAIRIGT